MFTGLTELALAARAARAERDAVASLDLGHFRSDRFNRAGHFVTQDDRLLDTHHAETAVQVIVQVGAADATGTDAHQHLVILHFRDRHILDAQVFFFMQYAGFCFHELTPE